MRDEALVTVTPPKAPQRPVYESNGHVKSNCTTFDLAAFIERNQLEVSQPTDWKGGGRIWEFNASPFCDHGGDGPFVGQQPDGALVAGCHHDSCKGKWGWAELRARFEPKQQPNISRLVPPSAIESSAATSVNPHRLVTATFAGVDAADLTGCVNEAVDWIVEGVISADQITLMGARSKATKTTQLADLSVALATCTDATCTDWLGVFTIPRARCTLFITGEANNRAISRRLDRACRARGKTLADVRGMLRVEAIDFPQLPSPANRAAVARTVAEFGIEVVVIDPLYRGLAGLDSARVTEIGGAIVEFAQSCQPASLILSHHCTKNAAREYGKPPELEDMTGAGVAECCGNWWLIGRNAPYEFDGMHDLCVSFGGRDEQAGARRIVFNERTWTFEVGLLHEYREAAANDAVSERQRQRDEAADRETAVARAKVKATLANQKTPLAKTVIRDSCGAARKSFEAAFGALLRDQEIVTRPYRDAVGRVQPVGFMLRDQAENYQFDADAKGSRTMPDDGGKPIPPETSEGEGCVCTPHPYKGAASHTPHPTPEGASIPNAESHPASEN